ncbi:hypothetical protein BHM03_00023461 [Ensete ventricosum]|nr:hypothetical protein BHM03_00023461 [Ensete ventricosum]
MATPYRSSLVEPKFMEVEAGGVGLARDPSPRTVLHRHPVPDPEPRAGDRSLEHSKPGRSPENTPPDLQIVPPPQSPQLLSAPPPLSRVGSRFTNALFSIHGIKSPTSTQNVGKPARTRSRRRKFCDLSSESWNLSGWQRNWR